MKNMLDHEKINELEVSLGLKKSLIEQFYKLPSQWPLGKAPKLIQTSEMAELAVSHDGTAIKFVSQKLITANLCQSAVMQNGLALNYIPEKYQTRALCELAVESNGLAIKYVPKAWITSSLAFKAVNRCLRLQYGFEDYPIGYIPKKFITKKLVFESVKCSPCSLKNIPNRFITKTICQQAFEKNPLVIKWIPEKCITREMCLTVIEYSFDKNSSRRISFDLFPDKMRNDKIVLDAYIQKFGAVPIITWNNRLLQEIKEHEEVAATTKPLSEDTVSYLNSKIIIPKAVEIETPPPSSEAILVKAKNQESNIYDLAATDDAAERITYYITDIHLEHQFNNLTDKGDIYFEKIINFLDNKISEMVSSAKSTNGVLLVGGDVSDSKELTTLFYQKLSTLWHGTIISILGNHELWDGHPEGISGGYISRPIEDIVNDYRKRINMSIGTYIKSVLLQNAVYIHYKNRQGCVIEENQILSAADEDLRDICSKASFILLGGIGFSGLDSCYNAEGGLYRSAVTTLEEDRELSQRFRSVYDKLNRCAGDKQVVVLTHTPVHDWTREPCNPNWIYINGHTHQNTLIRKQDGTTVLSDNQVGYKPTKWKLNGFSVSGWYDPFQNMEDGIHEITSEMYRDFNLGRGIQSYGCNHPGKIYALKRNGLYLFLLKSSSLCLLMGGNRKRLDRYDVQYYYENMELYGKKVREAMLPYHQALEAVSKEIKSFGGLGTIHGCIVDISYFSHVYINPFDGTIAPYYAPDICSHLVYEDLPSLLNEKEPELSENFLNTHKNGLIPLLSRFAVSKRNKKAKKMYFATVPELVLGTEMYKPSNIMRSIQYIFDQNVIRIWRDEILTTDFSKNAPIAEIEAKPKQIEKK